MKQNLAFILICLTILGCKKIEKIPLCKPIVTKNHTYDTIKPSDYLMTYPGSWWKYSNGTIDSCLAWKNVSIAEVLDDGNCKTIMEDMLVLPHCNYGYISFESSVLSYPGLQATKFIPVISETPGEIYENVNSSQTPQVTTTVTSYGKLTSITIGSTIYHDVIHMIKREKIKWPNGGGPNHFHEYYYARDIGLVRKIVLDYNNPYTDTFDLVDYYVAPH